jgi:hypothetical protein
VAGALDALVLGADLAPARQVEHEVGARVARALHRLVGAAVAADDDLEALARVVERQRVGHLAGDDQLLVVGGDDQRDAGQLLVSGGRGRLVERGWTLEARPRGQQREVADLRVDQQDARQPLDHGRGLYAAPG